MELFYFIGLVIFFIVYLFDKEVIRFEKDKYIDIAKTILIGSAAAIVINIIIGRFPPLPELSFGSLLCVGWEDLFFSVLLIYYPMKYLHRSISIPLAIIASLAFGLGHTYQGNLWALITCFYPFFISYKLGKKYGYGTVMALHVTYDITISITLMILNYIKG